MTSLIERLEVLRDHIAGMDSGSGDAALLTEAIAEIAGHPMTPKTEPLPMGSPDLEEAPDSDSLLEILDHIKYEDGNRNAILRVSIVRGLVDELLRLRSPPVPGDIREGVRSLCESEESPHIVADAILTYLHAQGYRRVPDRETLARWYLNKLTPGTDFEKYPDTKEACLAWADNVLTAMEKGQS